jgi:hypothetical protein
LDEEEILVTPVSEVTFEIFIIRKLCYLKKIIVTENEIGVFWE